MIITILIFIIILGLLVFVHEAGHFFAAKQSGMKVDEFGFGFPPRLVGIQKTDGRWKIVWGSKKLENTQDTVYSINWIPLGGFVKIVGENNEDENNPQSFINKPFWPRLKTLIAGVVMNFLLACLLLSAGYMYGLPVATDDVAALGKNARLTERQVAIIDVLPDSPAAKAGLQPSDLIVSINGRQFAEIMDAQTYVREHKGENLRFEVKRIDETKTLDVASIAEPPEGSGPTGVALANYGKVSYPWYAAIGQGVKTAVYQTQAIASGLYHLVFQGEGVQNLGGPVKIAQITGQVARLGFIPLMQFTAFLSLNLAILNIMPFPALDGGRVLFLIIEKIRGKRNNQNVEQIANTIGFLLLLLLMAIISARDILNTSVISRILG